MAISLRKLLEAAGDTLSAPQRNIGSMLSGDGLVDPYSDEADNYNPSELLVKGPGKLTGFGGFAADMLLDPLNLVGAGALGKMGAKAGMKAVEQAARQGARTAITNTAVKAPESSVALGKQMKWQVAGDTRRARRASDWNAIKAKLDRDTPWSLMPSQSQAIYQKRTAPELRRLLQQSQTKSDLPVDVQQFFNINSNTARMSRAYEQKRPNFVDYVESVPVQTEHIASAIKRPAAKRVDKQRPSNLLYGKRSKPKYAQEPEYYDTQSTEAQVQDFFSNEIRNDLLGEHNVRNHPMHWLKRAHTSSPRLDTNQFTGRPGTEYDTVYRNVIGNEPPYSGSWAANTRLNFMNNEFQDGGNMLVADVMSKANPYSSRHSQMRFELSNKLNNKQARERLRELLLSRPPLQSERSMNG